MVLANSTSVHFEATNNRGKLCFSLLGCGIIKYKLNRLTVCGNAYHTL